MAYNRGNLLFILYTEKILFEYESDLRSNEHHCSSSEKKAWKKLRPVRDLNPWPLQYRWSTLPTELTSQPCAGYCVGSK